MLHDIDTHSWDLNDGGVSVDFKGDNIEKMLSEIEEASNVVVGKDLKVEASWLEVGSEGEGERSVPRSEVTSWYEVLIYSAYI